MPQINAVAEDVPSGYDDDASLELFLASKHDEVVTGEVSACSRNDQVSVGHGKPGSAVAAYLSCLQGCYSAREKPPSVSEAQCACALMCLDMMCAGFDELVRRIELVR